MSARPWWPSSCSGNDQRIIGSDTDEFIGYVGPADIHGATQVELEHEGANEVVRLRSNEGRSFTLEFSGVNELDAYEPEGMLLYSISEMKAEQPYRRFVFTNWHDDDKSKLVIAALDLIER